MIFPCHHPNNRTPLVIRPSAYVDRVSTSEAGACCLLVYDLYNGDLLYYRPRLRQSKSSHHLVLAPFGPTRLAFERHTLRCLPFCRRPFLPLASPVRLILHTSATTPLVAHSSLFVSTPTRCSVQAVRVSDTSLSFFGSSRSFVSL